MADLATLKTRLDEAETALHALATGQQSVSVRYPDGKQVDFTAARQRELERYIANLRVQITRAEGGKRAPRLVFTG